MKIIGNWIHAHERDVEGTKVYVDAEESLPPSRGRQRLSLHADGTFIEGFPGADDRPAEASGTYLFDGSHLVLQRPDSKQSRIYKATYGSDGKSLQLEQVQRSDDSESL